MIGERLADLRRRHNMTQSELADKLSLSLYSVSKYERGEVEPNDETKIAIAKNFNVSIDYLLGLTDDCTSKIGNDSKPATKTVKTLLFADTREMCELVMEYKEKFAQNHIELITLPDCDGITLYNTICEQKPDAVVLDIIMREIDGLRVIQQYKEAYPDANMQFIVASSFASGYAASEAAKQGCRYFFVKPYHFNYFSDRVISILFEREARNIKRTDPMNAMVANMIHKIGVPPHIKGYQYLKEAILLTLDDAEALNGVTTVLYPKVAETFHTTPSRVERAIRHAIEVAWDRGDIETLQSFFGYTASNIKGKPTNSEFVSLAVDSLRLKMENHKK